jgi:hypothetical protein
VTVILCAGVLGQLIAVSVARPGFYLENTPIELRWFRLGVLLAATLSVLGTLRVGLLRSAWFPSLLVVHFCQGAWVIHASPNPAIDVFTVHKEAIAALMSGANPYAITFPNIYSDTGFYPPDWVIDGRVQFGFPYPPLTLLMTVPGELLLGDFRYSNLAAMTMTGALIGFGAPGVAAKLAAVMYLYTPRAFFVLEQSWTEPLLVPLLAATVICAMRSPSWTFLPLGGLLVAKQYMLLAAPAALLRLPDAFTSGRLVPLLCKTGSVAIILTVPFIVWDPAAFLRSVVLVQMYEPIRFDSLSYISALALFMPVSAAALAGPVLAAAAAGLALWRLPRQPWAIPAAVALITLVLFAFGKKAFCNYYFFVIGALACAIAALTGAEHRDADSAKAKTKGAEWQRP